MKVMTIVGTRPEIIRLACVIKRLDATDGIEHVLVHTGQNYDHNLNQVFFDDLGLRAPDHYLGVDTSSLGAVLGGVLIETERVLIAERPDAVLVLGDTNSCIATVMAKRMRIPTYHMEAGNRCFDENVPEETNRRLVDHTADFNLAYTEHARRNLLAEGLHPRRIIVTGSPMREVLESFRDQIDASDVLERLDLTPQGYFLVSAHREENVDSPARLRMLLDCLTTGARALGPAGRRLDPPPHPQAPRRARRRRGQRGPARRRGRAVDGALRLPRLQPPPARRRPACSRTPARSRRSPRSSASPRSRCATPSSARRRSTPARS